MPNGATIPYAGKTGIRPGMDPYSPGYGSGGTMGEATTSGGRSRQRLEHFVQTPYSTQFEGEAERIGGLEALAGQRETAALGGQEAALGRAQMAALGQGPSAAQAMMAQGMQQAERGQLAQAAEARGPGAALAGRQAQYAGAQAQRGAVGEAATLRAQEQLAAMGQEQQLATQMRGQALEGGLGYGRLGLGTREATAQEQLAQTQQRLQAEQGLEAARAGRRETAKLALGGVGTVVGSVIKAFSDERVKQAPSGPDPQKRKFDWQQFGRGLMGEKEPKGDEDDKDDKDEIAAGLAKLGTTSKGGLTTLAPADNGATSDESAKQAYQRGLQEGGGLPDGTPAIRDVMDSVEPTSFEYKTEPGVPRVGLVTKDLKKTPEGASAVSTGPDGLEQVDAAQASLMAMAGAADLHERLSEVEQYLKKPDGGRREAPAPTAVRYDEPAEDPQAKAASLMAAGDPVRRGIGQMRASAALPAREAQPVEETLAQLRSEQLAEQPYQRDVMTPAEIYADDLRKFRMRQVREGAVAMRPQPKQARDPVAEQIARTRGVPYSEVLAALGRTS